MNGPRPFLDAQLLGLLALLAVLAALAWWRGGGELVARGLGGGLGLMARFAVLIAVSFLAAGLFEVLVPQEWVRSSLGPASGARGVLLGTVAGALTPAGPFVSMPLAAVLLRSGAAAGTVVAFVSGWGLLALHRLLAWEVPVLGWRFALLRWGLCLGFPLLAGLAANALMRATARG